MDSRESSPISRRSSPSQSSIAAPSQSVPSYPELSVHDTKHTNDGFRQEIIILRNQVENLTSQNQFLESELGKAMKQLEAAKITAKDEAEKSRAAKVIKCLTTQLKKMAELVQVGSSNNHKSKCDTGQSSGGMNSPLEENALTVLASPRSESNIKTMNSILANGNKMLPVESEWVVQDDPGVYVTVCSLQGGGDVVKRVRFSRKRFPEEEAKKWWAENRNKVFERYHMPNR